MSKKEKSVENYPVVVGRIAGITNTGKSNKKVHWLRPVLVYSTDKGRVNG